MHALVSVLVHVAMYVQDVLRVLMNVLGAAHAFLDAVHLAQMDATVVLVLAQDALVVVDAILHVRQDAIRLVTLAVPVNVRVVAVITAKEELVQQHHQHAELVALQ